MADESDEEVPVEGSQNKDTKGLYAMLGVQTDADAPTIRHAYHQQSTLYHSDKLAGRSEEQKTLMNERFQRINEAYQILSDPRTRAAYDYAGKVGVERLALIPAHFTSAESISKALDALDFELEAKKAAKLVGSQGKMTISLNVLPLTIWPTRRNRPRLTPQLPKDMSAMPDSTVAGTDSAPASDNAAPTAPPPEQQQQAQEQQPQQPSSQDGMAAAAAKLQPSEMQVTPRKVILDGKEMFILVPGDQFQQTLLEAERSGAIPQPGAQVPNQNQGRGRRPPPSLMRRVAAALKPYQLELSHTFQIPLSFMRNANMMVSANAMQGKQGASTSIKLVVETVRSQMVAWSMAVRLAVGGIKVSVRQARTLSRIWALVSNLVLVDQSGLLPEYTIDLTRQLSKFATITNTWKMAVSGSGFFRTVIAHDPSGTGERAKSCSVTIGPGSVAINFSRHEAIIFSRGRKDEKRCRISQQLQFEPLSGTTHIVYDLLVPVGRLRKIGFGVSAQLPFCVTPFPFAPVVCNERWRTMTQFHLIFQQSQHVIAIPMLVSASTKLHVAVQLIGLPWAVYRLGLLFGKPVLELHEARKAREARKAIAEELKQAREKALLEQESLRSVVESRRAAEDSQNGLVIINATYALTLSRWADSNREESVPTSLDVTIPLQSLVTHSRLNLPEGSRAELPGFYCLDPSADPADVSLKISYWFRGVRHTATFTEKEAVYLPQVEHQDQSHK